jgi:CheY-like chemotaxis protein
MARAEPEHDIPDILLVEDNDDDVFLTREGLKEAQVKVNLHRVANGVECMDFLRRQGRYSAASQPDLVLLDLNMPLMDGREVLAALRREEQFDSVPVVVLTTSSAREDIVAAFHLRANAYVIKPTRFADFVVALRSIGDFWFAVSELPSKSGGTARH